MDVGGGLVGRPRSPTPRSALSSPLNAAKWRQHAGDLDDRLHFIEIADPDQG